ncbi:hypothetical protein Tco_1430958 [Tanacetum coccineum]
METVIVLPIPVHPICFILSASQSAGSACSEHLCPNPLQLKNLSSVLFLEFEEVRRLLLDSLSSQKITLIELYVTDLAISLPLCLVDALGLVEDDVVFVSLRFLVLDSNYLSMVKQPQEVLMDFALLAILQTDYHYFILICFRMSKSDYLPLQQQAELVTALVDDLLNQLP